MMVVSVRAKTRYPLARKFIPKFWMPGFRFLRPREEIEKGDFRWSRAKKCYVPVSRERISEIAGTIYTFVRREEKMPELVELPKGYYYLASDEKIKRGDLFWAIWSKRYVRVTKNLIGKEVGTISPIIRKVKS